MPVLACGHKSIVNMLQERGQLMLLEMLHTKYLSDLAAAVWQGQQDTGGKSPHAFLAQSFNIF